MTSSFYISLCLVFEYLHGLKEQKHSFKNPGIGSVDESHLCRVEFIFGVMNAPTCVFFLQGIMLEFLVGVGSIIHTALYPFPFPKKMLVETFVISGQNVGLPVERVNACWRLQLPGSLSSSKCFCPWPFPPQLLHPLSFLALVLLQLLAKLFRRS